VLNLQNKLSIFTEAAKGPDDQLVGTSFKVGSGGGARIELMGDRKYVDSRQSMYDVGFVGRGWEGPLIMCRELKSESYGVDLLHAIGRTYQSKAAHAMVSVDTRL
jgi:hypothetical protein